MNDEAVTRLVALGSKLDELESGRQAAMAEIADIVLTHREEVPLRQVALLTGLSRTTIYKMLEDGRP